ncbi:hypothetical protein [Streptomyces noursei]|nr:hypothetical protein [Streptomyces noursei]
MPSPSPARSLDLRRHTSGCPITPHEVDFHGLLQAECLRLDEQVCARRGGWGMEEAVRDPLTS